MHAVAVGHRPAFQPTKTLEPWFFQSRRVRHQTERGELRAGANQSSPFFQLGIA